MVRQSGGRVTCRRCYQARLEEENKFVNEQQQRQPPAEPYQPHFTYGLQRNRVPPVLVNNSEKYVASEVVRIRRKYNRLVPWDALRHTFRTPFVSLTTIQKLAINNMKLDQAAEHTEAYLLAAPSGNGQDACIFGADHAVSER